MSVDIGKAYFKWNQIPIKKKINIEEIDFKVNSLLKPFLVNVGNPHIVFFVKNLEKVCIETVENGSMTKDLAILVGPSTKYLNTNQFLDELDGNLKKKLN